MINAIRHSWNRVHLKAKFHFSEPTSVHFFHILAQIRKCHSYRAITCIFMQQEGNRHSLAEHLEYSEQCTCGRVFYTSGAMSNHRRSCKKSKSRLSGVFDRARAVFRSSKRLRLSGDTNAAAAAGTTRSITPPSPLVRDFLSFCVSNLSYFTCLIAHYRSTRIFTSKS